VSPTAQHSTMIGPLNPARFRIVKTPLKSTPPVPNCAKGCAAPKSDVMIHNLDLFLLAVRRGLSHRREILVHLIGTIRPERDHPFEAEERGVVDLRSKAGDGVGERDVVPTPERAHDRSQPASRDGRRQRVRYAGVASSPIKGSRSVGVRRPMVV